MASSRISGITIEIGGDTSSLSKALSGINSEIKETSTQLKDVEKLLKFDPTNTELLTQKQKALTTEIADTKTKLDTMKTAADQANDALANGEISQQQYDALQREIIATEEELKKLCTQAAEANETLQKIGAVGDTLQNVGSKISGVGTTLTKDLTAPLVALGTASVASSAEFESAMSQVAATMGTTVDQIQDLSDYAKEMGATTAFSATEAAEGLNILAMAGLSSEQQIAMLADVLNLASAGNLSLENAASYTVGAINGFGDSCDNAAYYTDLMAKGATLSNTSVGQLGEALGAVAANASSYGQSAEEMTLSLLELASVNVTGSEAATMLSRAMADIYTPTDAAKGAMEELGVSAYDSEGNIRDFNTVIEELDVAISGCSDEVQAWYKDTIFTTNGLKAFNNMTSASTEQVEAFKEGLADMSGSAAAQAATQLDNLNGQMTLLGSAISALLTSIGEKLTPIVSEVVEWVQNLVDKFNNLDDSTQETIVQVGLVVAAIGPLLTIVGKLTSTVGSAMSGISELGTKLLGVAYQAEAGVGPLAAVEGAISAISAPVVAVVAAIGTLVAAFATLWETNEGFRDSIIGIWENIKSTVGDFIQGVIDRINDLGFSFEGIQDIVDAVKQVWLDFCNVIAPVFEGAFQTVSDVISTVTDAILGVLDIFIGLFTGNWDQFWTGVSELVTNVWNSIFNFIENIGSTIWNVIGNFLGLINEDWQNTWNNIGEFISNIWENIKTAVSTALDNILSTVGNILGNIVTVVTDGLNSVKDFILNLVSQAFQWGSDLIGNIADGIKGAISKVTDAVTGVADKIKSFLHFSVPDEGPLTDIASWMPDMVQTLADGINQGTQTVSSACTQMASAAMNALESGLNQSLSIATSFTNSMNSLWTSWANNIQSLTNSMSSTLTQTFTTLFSTLTTNFNSFLASTESTLTSKINTWTQAVQTFLQNIEQTLTQSLTSIQTLTESTFQSLDQLITQYMTSISTNIQTMITQAVEAYTSVVNTLEEVTEAGFKPATDYIEGLVPQFKQWGIDMMDNLIDGIKSKEAALERELEKLADEISDYMEFSVPEKGPLSDADTWMPDMMKLFSEGIKDYSSLVTDQLKNLTTDMSIMTQSGNNNKQTINLNSQSVLMLDGKQIAQSVDNYLGVAFG